MRYTGWTLGQADLAPASLCEAHGRVGRKNTIVKFDGVAQSGFEPRASGTLGGRFPRWAIGLASFGFEYP